MPLSSCATGRILTVAVVVGFLVGTVTGSAAAAWAAGAAGALSLVLWSRARGRSARCGVGCAPQGEGPAGSSREDEAA